jgi:2-dehydro-3-deoxy-D-arabinonate dehydratase
MGLLAQGITLRIYRTSGGWLAETAEARLYEIPLHLSGHLTTREDLHEYLAGLAGELTLSQRKLPEDLLAPVEHQEIWASGVTYFRSRVARMEESKDAGGGDFYDRVYSAERPELFFKSTPHRVVGSGQTVRIRKDSKWNVPEPELTLLVSPMGKIIGYTIGNDMSSRDIEGENPLYLPQAKLYDRSCALGPAILVSREAPPPETAIRIQIQRGGVSVFTGATSLAEMKRRPETLVEYLFRDNSFPNGCFLLTGTGVVPPDAFTLQSGDEISITIDSIGTLKNTVE